MLDFIIGSLGWITFGVVLLGGGWCVLAYRQTFVNHIDSLQHQVSFLMKERDSLLFQKKSTEVRTGMIVEKLAPLSQIYPFDPENAHFLGQPIDYIQFDDDAVRIVEIKSGNAQLSKKQRRIKKLIKEGKVEFHILRVDHQTEDSEDSGAA